MSGQFIKRIFRIKDIWTMSDGENQIVLADPHTGEDFCRESESVVASLTEAVE